MKKRLEWFIVPCVATMFGGSTLTVNAQDPPKLRRVVVHQVHGDVDAKSIRDKKVLSPQRTCLQPIFSEILRTMAIGSVGAFLGSSARCRGFVFRWRH